MTACDNVFSVPELTEVIFLELSMTDLLCSVQRACKQWKAIIDSSTRLQQAVFFRPVRVAPMKYFWGISGWAASIDGPEYRTIVEHPLIKRRRSRKRHVNMKGMFHPDATWRRALVTQPPAAEIIFRVNRPGARSEPDINVMIITADPGVTLGQLILDEDIFRRFCSMRVDGWRLWKECDDYQLILS